MIIRSGDCNILYVSLYGHPTAMHMLKALDGTRFNPPRPSVDNEYDPSTEPGPITLTNLAEGKTASSSGSFYGGTADLANDGDTEANFYR